LNAKTKIHTNINVSVVLSARYKTGNVKKSSHKVSIGGDGG